MKQHGMIQELGFLDTARQLLHSTYLFRNSQYVFSLCFLKCFLQYTKDLPMCVDVLMKAIKTRMSWPVFLACLLGLLPWDVQFN